MNDKYDVSVIGAGIAGVSTALHLQMRGKKVALIDRRGPGQETSYGNVGVIQTHEVLPFGVPPLNQIPKILLNRHLSVRIHYPSLLKHLFWVLDFYLQSQPEARKKNGRLLRPLNASALDEHRILMQGTDAEKYLSMAGRIAIYRSKEAFEAIQWTLDFTREMGVPSEILDPQTIKTIESYVRPVFYKAVRSPSSARLTNPGAVVAAYAGRFTGDGGIFLQSEVRRLTQSQKGWSVEMENGTVFAEHVVVCAGPWANVLLKPLGYHFPLGIKRGYHRHYALAEGAAFAHSFSDVESGYVMAPMEQGCRLLTGVEIADIDVPPNPAQLEAVLSYARQLFPLGDAIEEKPWCGNRPCFVDSLPVVDRAPRHAGLWLNIGHGHSGMTIGPGTGHLLAQMMTDEAPFCDPAPYRATRFNC